MALKAKTNSNLSSKTKTPGADKVLHTPVPGAMTELLATTYALYLKTQNFHWNVTGPTFSMLHGLFESQYKELAEAVDLLAERIRALQYFAPGGFREFAELSKVKDAIGRKNAVLMLKELTADHRIIIALIQKLIVLTNKFNDEASQDVLVGRLRAHEKTVWMLLSSQS